MAVDKITGLYDFDEFMQISREYLAHNEGNFAVLIMDVSNFKYINKFYSRETGDVFIKEMADFFFTDNPYNICACRIDSEQFAMLVSMGKITRDEELSIISQLNTEFEDIMNSKYPDIYIHVYTGVYFMESLNEDLRQAFDKAKMSKTKMKGRFDISYNVYDPADYADKENIMEASNLFRKAAGDNRITIFLQPKIAANTEEVVGAEALARIVAEDGSIIPPARFIPALEQIGIIGALDSIMTEKVFELQKKWKDQGRRLFVVSVNVSRQEYVKTDFADRMIELSKRYKVPPEYVEFEILENMFVMNNALITQTTDILRDYGFRVSVDDFGSGYSSLNQIANMPADTVKMDISFARNSLNTKKGRIVVKSLINLLNNIDYDVVFEGIETEEQKELVASYGCNIIQGYFYSMPMSVEEFEAKYF
jgi:diguanylate cyclase (GGDEF)-like protein